MLFNDEPDLCTDCDCALNRPPTPPAGKQRPLTWYLRQITPDTLRAMCDTITETGIAQAEQGAAGWAAEHLDGPARSAYIGDVRGRAQLQFAMRCSADAQTHGQTMGWAR